MRFTLIVVNTQNNLLSFSCESIEHEIDQVSLYLLSFALASFWSRKDPKVTQNVTFDEKIELNPIEPSLKPDDVCLSSLQST